MAKTVAAGSSGDFTIRAGRTGVFTTTGEGAVRIKAGIPGAGFESRRVLAGAETLLGPFDHDVVVTIVGGAGSTSGRGRLVVPAFLIEDDDSISLEGSGFNGALGRRSTPVRVCKFGDSTEDPTLSPGTTQLDHSVYTVTFAVATAMVQTPQKWQLPSYYSQAYLVGAAGIGGQTTTDMLAREVQAASASRKSLTDCLVLKPDLLEYGMGINNLKGGTSGAMAGLVNTAFTEICTLIQRGLAANVPVVIKGVYGQDAAADVTDLVAVRAGIVALNALLAGYAATLPGKVFYLNPVGLVCDATGAFYPDMVLQDTLQRHLTVKGQSKIDQKLAEIMRSIFGRAQGPRYQGKNVLKNAAVVAANLDNNSLLSSYNSSGGFGGYPTGWTVGYLNGTPQNGRLEVIKGETYYVVEFVASSAGNYVDIYLPLDIANWVPVAGETWGAEFNFGIGGVTKVAPPVITLMSGELTFTSGGKTISLRDAVADASVLEADESGFFLGKVTIPPFKFPADTGALSAASLHLKVQTDDVVTWKIALKGDRLVQVNEPGDLTTQTFAPAAAGTVTVDASRGLSAVVTMPAGNITVAAPLNPQMGQELAYNFVQDATGSRTITWNAIFKKAADGAGGANGRGGIKFRYDGVNWVQSGGALAYF